MTTQLQFISLLFILVTCVQAQSPCSFYQHDEMGCVQSTYEACSWNDFLSSCLPTQSTNIGCSVTLNRLGCINQLQYPNQQWAYCRFSGYCREITSASDCSIFLSKPACLAVTGKACFWTEQCLEMTQQQLSQAIIAAQQNVMVMNQSNVAVCQSLNSLSVVHQQGAFSYLIQLVNSYTSNRELSVKYQNLLQIPGCLEVDANILNMLECTDTGVNIQTCKNITTPNQLCQFIQGTCQSVVDPSILNCSDAINKSACLSITNIKQPCYWNNQCLLYQGVASCGIVLSPVSPSFCAAINFSDADGNEQECFYYTKKQKCSQLCRSTSLQTTKKSCNSSNYNCIFQSNPKQCLFKGLKSQCGLIGQNKYSCMQANENCQFVNGVCKSMTDLSTSKCTDNLNQKACINLTKIGQLCFYDAKAKKCQGMKLDFFQTCSDLTNVNQNVCRRITDSACQWNNGSCQNAVVKVSCTTAGLNKIGCLASTLGPCQWSADAGLCQNTTIIANQTPCSSLKLVNEFACRMVSNRIIVGGNKVDELCKYNNELFQCESFTAEVAPLATYTINCLTAGLNKAACLSVADPTIACKWSSVGCAQVTSVTSACSGLMNVTAKVCAIVIGDPCTYDNTQNRCTTSVLKTPSSCTSTPVLNGQGCAFINPLNKKCYFDSVTLSCVEATDAKLATLECVKSYPNKAACLAITTSGQRCSWNTYKTLCEDVKMPTYDGCIDLTYVGVNTCKGYENDVTYYIDSSSYCTDADPPILPDDVTKCKQFDIATNPSSCFTSATSKPNLHACVGLTTGDCYFNISTFTCTILGTNDARFSQIKCKQANESACPKITTIDQYCIWDTDQKKCYYVNQCISATDLAACTAVTQPCVFKDDKCVLIMSADAGTYKCADAANEKACYKVAGEACVFASSTCSKLTQAPTDTCTSYASQKVNAIACGKITATGEKCQYDNVNHTCISTVSTTVDLCNLGQNEQNCLYDYNCDFNSTTGVCSIISSICTNATNLGDCMNVQETCLWNTADGKCKKAPDVECLDFTVAGNKYSMYTCGSVYASVDAKICSQNSDTMLCEEIVAAKCTLTTDKIDCTNVKNDCKFINNNCVQNLAKAKACKDNFTQYACLTGSYQCVWDASGLVCNDYNYEDFKCQILATGLDSSGNTVKATISASLCYNSNCYLDTTSLKCTVDDSTPSECADGKSPASCKSVAAAKNCYWDTDSKCKALLDLTKGGNLTYRQVSNSQKTLCLLPQNEGELTEWYEGQCYSVDSNYSLCTDMINIRACEAVQRDDPLQQCIYKNSLCQYSDPTTAYCTDTLNIFTCVAITTPGQFCVWLGQRCATLVDDGYPLGKYSTVNSNSCLRTYTLAGIPNASITNPLGVKFSIDGCIQSQPEIDTCNTLGLNYYGCLQSKVGSCAWNGSKCVDFTSFTGKAKCSDYTQVSAGVCVQVPDLKCTWKNYNCINATNIQLCSDSLSQAACVAQTQQSCKWVNNSCQNQIIVPGVTSCGVGTSNSSTAQYSSVMSCQSVSFGALPCSHNGTGCSMQIDPLTAKCNFPGLNDVACTMVKLQQCIYQDGKCQIYQGASQQCRSLIAVSPQVCAGVTDSNQFCKFSSLNNKCTVVNNYDLCTSVGINPNGCNSLSSCTWHKDQNYCSCTSALVGVKFCADYANAICIVQPNCLWDSLLNSCRAKMCSDLPATSCVSAIANNSYCYYTQAGKCQSAKTCEDIRDVGDCTKIIINGVKCQTHAVGICRTFKCSDILVDASCNGNCFWTGTYCDKRVCQSFSKKDKCLGNYDDGSCFWFNNMCLGLKSCYELTQYYDDDVKLEQACNLSNIGGNKCNWQLTSQYASTYECSHNQCNPLGSSKINCSGAEIDKFVCVLSTDFQCKRCEDISNGCECQEYNGNCIYSNNKCRSIQCAEFVEQSCPLYPDKCMWHTASKSCLIVCSKLGQDACESRHTKTNQCYWEAKLKRCNTGTPSVIVIDTVSPQLEQANVTIIVSNSFILGISILIGIFI